MMVTFKETDPKEKFILTPFGVRYLVWSVSTGNVEKQYRKIIGLEEILLKLLYYGKMQQTFKNRNRTARTYRTSLENFSSIKEYLNNNKLPMLFTYQCDKKDCYIILQNLSYTKDFERTKEKLTEILGLNNHFSLIENVRMGFVSHFMHTFSFYEKYSRIGRYIVDKIKENRIGIKYIFRYMLVAEGKIEESSHGYGIVTSFYSPKKGIITKLYIVTD